MGQNRMIDLTNQTTPPGQQPGESRSSGWDPMAWQADKLIPDRTDLMAMAMVSDINGVIASEDFGEDNANLLALCQRYLRILYTEGRKDEFDRLGYPRGE